MDYIVKDTATGKRVEIDLPLEITCNNFSFQYFDEDSSNLCDSKLGSWVVDSGESTPKHFVIKVKEFKTVTAAVNHARLIYLKFLKEERHRVKGCDIFKESF